MKKLLFLLGLIFFLFSCKTNEFKLFPYISPYSGKLLQIRIDSIVVDFCKWSKPGILERGVVPFHYCAKRKAIISDQDSLKLIQKEIADLKYDKDVCHCSITIRALCRVYFTERYLISTGEENECQSENTFDFTVDGRPMDESRMFDRSARLIELLQLPPCE